MQIKPPSSQGTIARIVASQSFFLLSKSFGVNEKDTPSGARAVEQTVVETTAETAKPFGIKTAGDLPVSLVPISLNISGVSSAKETKTR